MTASSWEQVRKHLESGHPVQSGSFRFTLSSDKTTVYGYCTSCDDSECYVDPEPIDQFCKESFWHKPNEYELIFTPQDSTGG